MRPASERPSSARLGDGEAQRHGGDQHRACGLADQRANRRQGQDDERELGALREEEAELCRSRHRPAEDEARRGVGEIFTTTRRTATPITAGQKRTSAPRSRERPTEIKKKPSSRPRNGLISDRINGRYGVSAMIMPPRKAPKVNDRPIAPVAHPAASATRSAIAVKTSSLRVARNQVEQGPDQTGEQHRDPQRNGRLQERQAHGRGQGFAGAERGSHDEEEDRGHVLEDQDGGRREPDRTVLLMPLGDEPGDHRGRGERQRRPDHKRRHGRQAEQKAEEAERERAGQHLHRSEAEDVARLFADMAEREVQADVEEQEHDPELGQRRDHSAVGDESRPTPLSANPRTI